MLSLTEIITYMPGSLFVLGGVMLLFIFALLFFSDNDTFGGITFALISFVLGLFIIVSTINSSMEYKTITPCAIADGLVVDTSDTMYNAAPDVMIKLHLNQTTNVTVLHQWLAPHGIITETCGSACSTYAANC